MALNITGRKLFVKALKEEGVDTIFAYPGGMITDIMDELYKTEGIRVVLGRHEQALATQLANLDLIAALFCEVNPIPVKAGVELIGLASAHYRLPLAPMAPANRERLEGAMKERGLIA